jgi:CRP-like cAMP-binding protein
VTSDYRALLAGTSIFSGLERRDLDTLLGLCVRQRFVGRQIVLRKGDPALQLFVIARGRLKAVTPGGAGREAALSIMGPGEVFGEVALFDGEPRSATITALEPGELLCLPRNDFLRFLERSPTVAVRLLEVLARRLRRLSERVEDGAFLELPARLAKLLCRLAERHGTAVGAGAVHIGIKLSQQELGDLVGASRETVNKQLRAWARRGLVERRAGYLVIRDLAAMRALGRPA